MKDSKMENNIDMDINKEAHIYKAKRKVGSGWIMGFPLIIDNEWYIRSENDFRNYKIDVKTLCCCTVKRNVKNELIFEHDYIESMGTSLVMEICYGEYQAYCPVDDIWLPTIGFYAKAENYKDMPIGDLPEYALRLYNRFDKKREENENSEQF